MRRLWESYDEFAQRRELVRIISQMIHVPASIIFTVILILMTILLFKGTGTIIVSLFFFYVYPAYMTFKSLRVGKPGLMLNFGKYWVVLGFVAFVYTFTEWVLKTVPFFGFFKCLFAYLLIRNDGAGAVFVYDNILFHILARYELFIDKQLDTIKSTVEEGKKEIRDVKDKAIASIIKDKSK